MLPMMPLFIGLAYLIWQNENQMCQKEQALDLDNSQYQVKLGIAHSMNNSSNLAKPCFQETAGLKTSNLSAHYNLAPCLFNIGESESAVVEDR